MTILSLILVFLKPERVKLTCQSIPFEKVVKKSNLIMSQNSENGVPVVAGVQVRVIETGHFWSSNLIRFGGAFGSVKALGWPPKGAKRAFRQGPKKELC